MTAFVKTVCNSAGTIIIGNGEDVAGIGFGWVDIDVIRIAVYIDRIASGIGRKVSWAGSK